MKKISTPFNKLLTLLIAAQICGSVSHEISFFHFKNKIIKQHTEDTILNFSRQDNIRFLTQIIQSGFQDTSSFNTEVKYANGLKLEDKLAICLSRINKYPRWSKSTFS